RPVISHLPTISSIEAAKILNPALRLFENSGQGELCRQRREQLNSMAALNPRSTTRYSNCTTFLESTIFNNFFNRLSILLAVGRTGLSLKFPAYGNLSREFFELREISGLQASRCRRCYGDLGSNSRC